MDEGMNSNFFSFFRGGGGGGDVLSAEAVVMWNILILVCLEARFIQLWAEWKVNLPTLSKV